MAGLEDELGLEALEVGRDEHVRLVAERERAGCVRPCQRQGLSVAMTSVLGRRPMPTSPRTIELMWPSSAMCSGSRSSVQGEAVRAELLDERKARRGCAAEASRISTHAGAEPLAALAAV